MNKETFTFLLRWVLVTAFGSALGLAVAFGVDGDEDYRPLFLLLGFVISGLIGGVGQWAMLRKKTRKTIWGWIPATALGVPTGLFIGFWVNQFLWLLLQNYWYYWTAFLSMSIIAGLFTGKLQWSVLFSGSPTPVWLFLSSVSLIGIPLFYPHPDNPIYFLEPLNKIFLGVIFGGLMGLLLGIVSGVNITRVLGESGDG